MLAWYQKPQKVPFENPVTECTYRGYIYINLYINAYLRIYVFTYVLRFVEPSVKDTQFMSLSFIILVFDGVRDDVDDGKEEK